MKLWIFLLFGIFLINFVSSLSYDWNFSTPSDYIYNSTEISVYGGNAYLNQISILPYALWHLNELNGTTFNDSSLNGFNGTTTNTPVWSSGKLNNSLLFNGANNFATLGSNVAQFNGTTPVSYSFWFYTTSSASSMAFMSNYNNSQFKGLSIHSVSNKVQFNLYASNTKYLSVTCNNSYSLSNWHFAVITYDGSLLDTGLKIYIDNVLQLTTTGSNTLNDSTISNGVFYLARRIDGYYWNGKLDEIIIYKKVLTPLEINYSYNLGLGTESFLSASPLGYYTIQPKTNFTYIGVLNDFLENSTKINSQIQYVVSVNDIWKYYNGSSWVVSNGSWIESNNVSIINANIKTLGNSGNFTFKAILHSDLEGYIPYLDNVKVSECIENWVANYSACNIFDNQTKNYYDSNSCGTFDNFPVDNGTISSCDYCTPNWICNLFDNVCESYPFPIQLNCIQANDTMNPTCCQQTNLTSDCSLNLNLFNKLCGTMNQVFIVPTYPYVDLNVSYPIEYKILLNNISTYIGFVSINITNLDGNSSIFNFTWYNSSNSYKITLFFTEEGNYPFKVFSYYPYLNNFIGTFIVRQSFNVTFCGFRQSDSSSYKNDYAYLLAEFTTAKKYYDGNLEQFITPLGFATTFKTPVFHTLYRNGCGTFKLYEKNTEYAIRLFDGIATFQTTFSQPNITKTYGTNIYFGKYTMNGSTENFSVLFSDKDIRPYFWLFNWLFIIAIVGALIISIFLFFVIPQMPTLSIIFGVGFITMAVLIRIALWIWLGF